MSDLLPPVHAAVIPPSEKLNPENLRHVLEAYVHRLRADRETLPSGNVAIAFDGRRQSREFAIAASELFSGSGFAVLRSDAAVPLPAFVLATRRHNCEGGVMFTGGSAPPGTISIDFRKKGGLPFSKAERQSFWKVRSGLDNKGLSSPDIPSAHITELNLLPDYRSYLRSRLDIPALKAFAEDPKNNAGVLIDSMGGVGETMIEEILSECGWRAQTLFGTIQPDFFDRHPNPVSENLAALSYNVKATDAQLGIATDGDGGRCGIALPTGKCLEPSTMARLLLWHLVLQRKMSGGVVADQTGSEYLGRAISNPAISVITTEEEVDLTKNPVGGWFLGVGVGGEFSFGPELPCKDGILTGLLFTEIIALSGMPLPRILEESGRSSGVSNPAG